MASLPSPDQFGLVQPAALSLLSTCPSHRIDRSSNAGEDMLEPRRTRSEASPQTAKKDLCSLDRVVKIAELGSIDLRRTFGGRPLRGRLMLGPIT
jgi:hypothetical protein